MSNQSDFPGEPVRTLKGFELAANAYADLGFDVFPAHSMYKRPKVKGLECTCMPWRRKQARKFKEPEPMACENAGKHARFVDSWQRRATTDRDIIAAWAKEFKDDPANIGIATGPRSGIWILDIDGEKGERSLSALEAEHGALPETVVSITGSGGKHYFFRWHDGMKCVGR